MLYACRKVECFPPNALHKHLRRGQKDSFFFLPASFPHEVRSQVARLGSAGEMPTLGGSSNDASVCGFNMRKESSTYARSCAGTIEQGS